MIMNLIKLQNKSLSNLINSEIIPLAPSSVVSQFFFLVLAIDSFDFLELFHELEIDSCNFFSSSKLWMGKFVSFGYLNINSNEEIGKELDI